MRIALIIEGKTEKAFLPYLRSFLRHQLPGKKMPDLNPFPCDGRLPKQAKLKRAVEALLNCGARSSDVVIALTDVYTGTGDFTDAADAKNKMRQWVGPEPRFYPHAAQHDFEAWLLPYWSEIQRLAGHNRRAPAGAPEMVNHNDPPSERIKEVFRSGTARNHYNKPRDAARILRGQDLMVSVEACPELKAFINTILALCGGEGIE